MIAFLLAGLSALVIGLATEPIVMLTTNVTLLNDIDFTPKLADSTSDEYIFLEKQNKDYLYLPIIGVLEEEKMTLKEFNMTFSKGNSAGCVTNETEIETKNGKTIATMRLEYYRYLTNSENITDLTSRFEISDFARIPRSILGYVWSTWS